MGSIPYMREGIAHGPLLCPNLQGPRFCQTIVPLLIAGFRVSAKQFQSIQCPHKLAYHRSTQKNRLCEIRDLTLRLPQICTSISPLKCTVIARAIHLHRGGLRFINNSSPPRGHFIRRHLSHSRLAMTMLQAYKKNLK
jgi:hypothetical protein